MPTLALSHLSETGRRAYVLADNKLALNAGWDRELLAIELQALVDLKFDTDLTGFSLAEVDLDLDLVLDEAGEADSDGSNAAEDVVPAVSSDAVSRRGDLWVLGNHRLLCGDTQQHVEIDGNVCGLGSGKHREFAFASGEMNRPQFVAFLKSTLGNLAGVMRDGAIAYVCVD